MMSIHRDRSVRAHAATHYQTILRTSYILVALIVTLIIFSSPVATHAEKTVGWERTLRAESSEYNIEDLIAIKLTYSVNARVSYQSIISGDSTKLDVSLQGGTLDIILEALPTIPIIGGQTEEISASLPIGSELKRSFFQVITLSVKMEVKALATSNGQVTPVTALYDTDSTKSFELLIKPASTNLRIVFKLIITISGSINLVIFRRSFSTSLELVEFPESFAVDYHQVSVSGNQMPEATVQIGGLLSRVSQQRSFKFFAIPGSYTLAAENMIPINPNERYVFSSWSGDVQSTSSSLIITISRPTSVTANYKRQFLVTATPPDLVEGAGWYDEGAIATLKAKEYVERGTGIRDVFSSWSGDASGITPTVSVNVTKPLNIAARCVRQYWVQVLSERGTPILMGKGTTSAWFDEGETVQISIDKRIQEGLLVYTLKGWVDEISGLNFYDTITVNTPLRLKAIWETDYTLLLSTIGLALAVVITLAILVARKRAGRRLPPPPPPP